ncbi:hypothetical protein M758_10G083300 [Ceratodon purpureus]|nr:hypothetical protein M758_10G083300 [Ceratodon purpureus]
MVALIFRWNTQPRAHIFLMLNLIVVVPIVPNSCLLDFQGNYYPASSSLGQEFLNVISLERKDNYKTQCIYDANFFRYMTLT